MTNFNQPQTIADAAFQQMQNTLINQARDADLSIKHRREWEARKIMVLVEPPIALRTAIRARQDAIQREQQRHEERAKSLYNAGLEALKRRYRERRDITGVEYDAGQRELHNEWQARRADLARRYVHTFADARLKEIQEQVHTVSTAVRDAEWEREGAALIESYAMPEPPSWATQSAHPATETTPTRRRVAAR